MAQIHHGFIGIVSKEGLNLFHQSDGSIDLLGITFFILMEQSKEVYQLLVKLTLLVLW
ncbi:hypothetical protein D3C76_797090 [compost metagenome]